MSDDESSSLEYSTSDEEHSSGTILSSDAVALVHGVDRGAAKTMLCTGFFFCFWLVWPLIALARLT